MNEEARTSETAPAPPVVLAGLAEVAGRYDGYILDAWGCIHDGVKPYPGVVEALERLRTADKRVVVLSNAPRRAALVLDGLEGFGLARTLFDGVLTSGEVAWQALRARDDPWHARLGSRVLLVGPPRDLSMIEGNGLVAVKEVAAADFLLVTGPFDDAYGVEHHAALLDEALNRRLPLICANPDLVVMRGSARLVCAGALAAYYGEHGGEVRQHGKPYPSVYVEVMSLLGGAARRRVLAVGDGLMTDIAGANAAGLDCAFIPGGIHGAALGVPVGGVPPLKDVVALAAAHAVRPTYVIPGLRW